MMSPELFSQIIYKIVEEHFEHPVSDEHKVLICKSLIGNLQSIIKFINADPMKELDEAILHEKERVEYAKKDLERGRKYDYELQLYKDFLKDRRNDLSNLIKFKKLVVAKKYKEAKKFIENIYTKNIGNIDWNYEGSKTKEFLYKQL